MKKLLLLLLLASLFAISLVPTARAYEKDPWHQADKTLGQLRIRMDGVRTDIDRFGANPRLRDQIAQLKFGIADLAARVGNHAGDPKVARAKANDLSDLMSQVEVEYRDRAHRAGVVLQIYTGQ